MTKKLLILFSLLPIFAVASNAYITKIAEKTARTQQGFDRFANKSKECNYQSTRMATNDDSYISYTISIHSDINSIISGTISFGEKDIPLHDGAIFSDDNGNGWSYKNGVLKYQDHQGNGPFSVLLTEIELEVSSDLKEISSIHLQKIVKPLLGFNNVDTELICKF